MVIERPVALQGCVSIIADPEIGDGLGERQIDLPLADDAEFSGLAAGIDVTNVGSFPPKQVFGEFDNTSHQVLSSFGQISWAGGGQKDDSQESSDTDRFAKLASLETRFPRALTLLPLSRKIAGPNTTGARIVGNLLVSGNREFFVTYSTAMRRISGAGLAGAFSLPVVNNNPGIGFLTAGVPTLYIPLGASGYVSFDGATVSALQTAVKPLNFMVLFKKLWTVDIDGNVSKSVDGVNWTFVLRIEPDYLPRGIIAYYNRADEFVPHVVTDSVVFAIDENTQQAYETDVSYAPHPAAGAAFERWRTDLYVSMGLGIQRYTGSTINPVGLDRDDGVGAEWSGSISSLERGNNDLFVGLTADPGPGTSISEVEVDFGEEIYLSQAAGKCTIERINGSGVPHTLWVAPDVGGTVRDLTLTSSGGAWRLFWVWKGDVYYQDIAQGFDNPAQNPTQDFEESGELTSPWLDFGMKVDRMTMAAFEFEVKNATATEKITLEFQSDTDDLTDTWRPVVELTAPGHWEVRVGLSGLLPDHQPRYRGVPFFRMRYRIKMQRDPADTKKRPVLESVTIAFIKRMRRLKSFEFVVDCNNEQQDAPHGLSNRQRADMLDRLIDAGEFIPFGWGDRWTVVKFAYVSGRERTGTDFRGNKRVSVIMPYEQTVGS